MLGTVTSEDRSGGVGVPSHACQCGRSRDASVCVQMPELVQGNVLRQGVSLCWPLRGGLR